VFRVDMRLRPYGNAGPLVPPFTIVEKYYKETAALWEIQATLKLRPLAGNLALGDELLARLHPLFLIRRGPKDIVASIQKLRETAVKIYGQRIGATTDVKTGIGGLRDIEFLVQGLQLMHACDHPEILTGNTLQGLYELAETGLLSPSVVDQLTDDYIFLRRVEHYLQILEDRQIHSLPTDPAELTALARRMLGTDARPETFSDLLSACLRRVRDAYLFHLSRSSK